MGMNSFTTCFASALGVALVAMLAASGPTEWLGLGSTTGVCEIDATEGVPDNFAERYYAAGKPVLLRKHRANRVSCMEESMCALRSFQINFAEFQEHGLAVEGSVTVVQPKSLPPAIRTPAPFFDGPGVWAAIHADAPQLLVGVGYKPDGPWRAERDKWVEVPRGRYDWLLYPPQTIPPGGFGGGEGAASWEAAVGSTLEAARRPLRVQQKAGEVLYVPEGWHHAVVAAAAGSELDPQPSVALEQRASAARLEDGVVGHLHAAALEAEAAAANGAPLDGAIDRLRLAAGSAPLVAAPLIEAAKLHAKRGEEASASVLLERAIELAPRAPPLRRWASSLRASLRARAQLPPLTAADVDDEELERGWLGDEEMQALAEADGDDSDADADGDGAADAAEAAEAPSRAGAESAAAEAELGDLASKLARAALFGLATRASAQRHALVGARELNVRLADARAAFDAASVRLLGARLDAHAVGLARTFFADNTSMPDCGTTCVPPTPLVYNGAVHGVATADVSRFMLCCVRTQRVVADAVARLGAEVNAQNDVGYAPIHFAALRDSPWLINELASHGAVVNATTRLGSTALHAAAWRNATAAIKAILAHPDGEAMKDQHDNGGRTAAFIACSMGHAAAAVALGDTRKSCAVPVRLDDVPRDKTDGVIDLRANLDATEFVRDYLSVGRPVVLRGALTTHTWSTARWAPDQMLKRQPSLPLQVAHVIDAPLLGEPHRKDMPLKEYVSTLMRAAAHEAADGLRSDRALGTAAVSAVEGVAAGLVLPSGDHVMDANKTGIDIFGPLRLAIGPRGAGEAMAPRRASVFVQLYGSATYLLLPPAAAAYSTLHPADATAEVPWAWPAEVLFSADTDAGDVLFVPDGWSASNMFNVEAVTLAAEVETGVGEFSVALK